MLLSYFCFFVGWQSARDARISEFRLGGSKIAQGASKSTRDARISEFGLGGIKIGRGGRSNIAQGVITLTASDARKSNTDWVEE